MEKTILFMLISMLTCSLLQAQCKLFFNDGQEGIEGVVLTGVQSQYNDDTFFVSGEKGIINIDSRNSDLIFIISHPDYRGIKDTVNCSHPINKTYQLKPADMALDEVVITGQYMPQSIDQSVNAVTLVSAGQIEAQGAVDLTDALRNVLNLNVAPNSGDGTSKLQMQGLGSEYIKFLIDGVPFVGIDGDGNNADISQINVSDIERIEILEGPASTIYGANAAAGVINIITKSNHRKGYQARIAIQEETVGSEYGMSQGKHIQNASFGTSIAKKSSFGFAYNHIDFDGYKGDLKGLNHTSLTDESRGFQWRPKEQNQLRVKLDHQFGTTKLNYSLSLFKQNLYITNNIVQDNDINSTFKVARPFARDQEFLSRRMVNSVVLSGRMKHLTYNTITAYSIANRNQYQFKKFILSGNEENRTEIANDHRKSLMSRGFITNNLNNSINYQLGYEYTLQQLKEKTIASGEKKLGEIALFASQEYQMGKALMVKPSLRTIYHSKFKTPLIYALSIKYDINPKATARLSSGRSYRTPMIEELYFRLVDANHDVQGNELLLPETGFGYALDLQYEYQIGLASITSKLKIFKNRINNRIDLEIVQFTPQQSKYINIDLFKSKGVSLGHQVVFRQNTRVNAGMSYVGYYNDNYRFEESFKSNFFYSPEYTINIRQAFPKVNLSFAAFFKYTGKRQRFVSDTATEGIRVGTQQAFHALDATVIWKPVSLSGFNITGGVKNALNFGNINSTATEGGAHTDAPSVVGLSYGRSYFLKLSYQFTK